MAAKVHATRRKVSVDKAQIFAILRKRIGEALQDPGLKVRPASQLELAISTFAPSTVLSGYRLSDYPFPKSRYVSAKDGHVYIVARATDDGKELVAYRLGFLQSVFTHRGGLAVSITADAWMEHAMIMYSISHEHFDMRGGLIQGIADDATTRRSYPLKKAGVYFEFIRRQVVRWPLVQNIIALTTRA